MVDAVLRGFGLAYILEEQVTAHIKEKQLVRVLEPYCEPFPGLSLYYPKPHTDRARQLRRSSSWQQV